MSLAILLFGVVAGIFIFAILTIVLPEVFRNAILALAFGGIAIWLSRDPYNPSTPLLVLGALLVALGLVFLIFGPHME